MILSFSCSKNDIDTNINRVYPSRIGEDSFIYNDQNQLVMISNVRDKSCYTEFIYKDNLIDSIYKIDAAFKNISKYFYNDQNQIEKTVKYFAYLSSDSFVSDTTNYTFKDDLLFSSTIRTRCRYYSYSENFVVDSMFTNCDTFFKRSFIEFDNKNNPFLNLNLPFDFEYILISGFNNWKNNKIYAGWASPTDPPYYDSDYIMIEYDNKNFPIKINSLIIEYVVR